MKYHAKAVHRTTEAKALGQLSAIDMMTIVSSNEIETESSNTIEETKEDKELEPAHKVRIICNEEASGGEHEQISCWSKEEKDILMN